MATNRNGDGKGGGAARAGSARMAPAEQVVGPRNRHGKPQVRAHRRDGFTAEKRDAFFAELAETCNVDASARHAGITASTVRKWRRRNPEFAERYAQVIADAYADLEMRLLAMMKEGVTGEQWEEVGTDGITRLRYRRDNPGQLRLLLVNHQHERALAAPPVEPERAPRETLDELIERLRARLDDIEAGEGESDGGGH